MKNITAQILPVSALPPEAQQHFIEWAEASRPLTRMDPEVVSYPRAAIIAAGDDVVRAFATVQSLLFIDNFIPRPGLEDRKRVLALGRMSQLIDRVAQDAQHREVMFTTKDKDYAAIACNHGWTQQEGMIVLRKKVGEPNGRR